MSDSFDPYYLWLGIPPEDQPPKHYRLLGVSLFEGNADVVDSEANRQIADVQTHESAKHSTFSPWVRAVKPPGRLRDLADVQDLIKALPLAADFAGQLNPFVQAEFLKLHQQVQDGSDAESSHG